ncbi:hypothetical protein BH23VER1_BH23VER1_06790 [soil metagenome]
MEHVFQPGRIAEAVEVARTDGGTCVRKTVASLTRRFGNLWERCPATLPQLDQVPAKTRRANQRRSAESLARLDHHLLVASEPGLDRDRWERELREEFRGMLERLGAGVGQPRPWKDLLSDSSFEVTATFLKQARAFGPELRAEDHFQALRNVWIMNSIQLFRGAEVSSSPSILAYSLLYPFTDNVLDDPHLSQRAKSRFCRRLGRRLAGIRPAAPDAHEAKVFELVSMIEAEFPRARFPQVFDSLLAIHHAQVKSLDMQGPAGLEAAPDLVSLTMEKGGTSVLADAYLLDGRLGDDEAEFQFGFGALLQLLDDAQDINEDLQAGHQTLFSTAAGAQQALDALWSRAFHFMDAVLETARCFPDDGRRAARDLVGRSCSLMLMATAADNAGRFSPAYLLALEASSPFGFAFLRRQRPALQRLRRRLAALPGGTPPLLSSSRRTSTRASKRPTRPPTAVPRPEGPGFVLPGFQPDERLPNLVGVAARSVDCLG